MAMSLITIVAEYTGNMVGAAIDPLVASILLTLWEATPRNSNANIIECQKAQVYPITMKAQTVNLRLIPWMVEY